ncbi:signal peptide peptidase SppA [Veronia pacifica]|uniref:Signal peptide peptidase SppA n=1 Tax=Veronia pacifica TaxID=1080227 RepID=A0A1C3EJV1_9GAMM|nr:signal peptide peptidase SppA [Veronia pacifica]ODA33508.1 signal peptide peptidase SppA [Veronia pacifica]
MKKLFKFIANIFRWAGKTLNFLRLLITNLLFIALIAIIYIAVTTETSLHTEKDTATLVGNRALLVDIDGPIVEQRSQFDPYDIAKLDLLGQSIPSETVLFDVVDKIRAAAEDDKINGLVLSISGMPETSLTQLRYIAKAIKEFKKSGKKVVAIGGHYSQSQYYLASLADEVMMSPDGAVLLQGYGSYNLYLKELLEKLNVTTHVFRVGTYKSFVEPYTRSSMSAAARESSTNWLNQLWNAYVQDVASNRNINASVLTPSAKNLKSALAEVQGDFAVLSKRLGLIDKLATRQEMRKSLAEDFGSDGKDSFNYVSIYDYALTPSSFNFSTDQIAVVVASGGIVDGVGQANSVGGDSTAKKLRDALLNKDVKAVVLRVNSPGGSAFASEVIRNGVDALRSAGKPVVVSMSSVAASGGYWISSSADRIIAQPTTITGSIGIFAVLTTFEKILEEYGVYNDGVGTTPFASLGVTRALPEEIGDIMQLGINHGYQRFISLVANHRNMPMAEVDGIAQGRVWTGSDALKNGLVDQLGDFDDALVAAAELAGLKDYSLNWMQEELTPAEQFFYDMINQVSTLVGVQIKAQLPTVAQQFSGKILEEVNTLSQFNDPNGRYAFCLNCNYYQ